MSSEVIPSEENMAIAARVWQELINGRNWDLADDLLHPNCEFHAAGIREDEVRGPDGVRNLFEQLYEACPNISFDVDHQETDESYGVITYWRAEGTATGPREHQSSVSTKYTGAHVAWRGMSYSHFSNDRPRKIAGLWVATLIQASGGTIGKACSVGEPETFTEEVVPGEGESLRAGEVFLRVKRRKPAGCRMCACLCCR